MQDQPPLFPSFERRGFYGAMTYLFFLIRKKSWGLTVYNMSQEDNKKIFNPKRTKKQRKYLRNNMTKAEVILWSKLKGKKLKGYKFRRQHGIGDYIIDFYCPKLNLAIEVDGETHYTLEGKQHDGNKESYLEELGVAILRFTNPQVKQNLDGVIEQIASFIKDELK